MNLVFEIFKNVHRHANNSSLSRALSKPLHAAFHNPQTLQNLIFICYKMKKKVILKVEADQNVKNLKLLKESNALISFLNVNGINSSFHCSILRVDYVLSSMLPL